MGKRNLIKEIVWVALGGMIGATLRQITNQFFYTHSMGTYLFTATAFENILGSYLIGLIYQLLSKKLKNNPALNLFLLTGIIGSYTTYSGFMIESLMISSESYFILFGYIFFQIALGIAALWFGLISGNRILKAP